MHFKDRTIWITGASSGIGSELARQLAAQKAKLILTGRNQPALAAVQQDCLKHTPHCTLLPADITESTSLGSLCENAIAVYGHLDGVIHSAGVTQRSLAVDTNLEVYRRLMEINFFAPVNITQLLMPHFQQRGESYIVAVSSMAGLMGFPMRTGYAAAKHALKGWFETLQTETTNTGMHITIVSPGRIKTPISYSALTGGGQPHGKMDEGQAKGIPVEYCAKQIIKAMEHKKRHIIIARQEKLLWWLWWFVRPLYYKIAAKKGLQDVSATQNFS